MPLTDNARLSRRRFLQGLLTGAISGHIAEYYALQYEPFNLEVTRTDVFLPRWPSSANGLKIGFLSDFHNDNQAAVNRSARAVELLMNEQPDLVVFGGDLITNDGTLEYLIETMKVIEPMTRAPLGAYAIMGNHDVKGKTHSARTRQLNSVGFSVLNNRSVPLPGTPGAYLVGLDDAYYGFMNVEKALQGVPKDAPKVALLHEPDFADTIGTGFDLQLSGHSHGGQIRLPGFPPLFPSRYGRKYVQGLEKAKHHLVYTSRGIGTIGLPVRTFCRPEVAIITLYKS